MQIQECNLFRNNFAQQVPYIEMLKEKYEPSNWYEFTTIRDFPVENSFGDLDSRIEFANLSRVEDVTKYRPGKFYYFDNGLTFFVDKSHIENNPLFFKDLKKIACFPLGQTCVNRAKIEIIVPEEFRIWKVDNFGNPTVGPASFTGKLLERWPGVPFKDPGVF